MTELRTAKPHGLSAIYVEIFDKIRVLNLLLDFDMKLEMFAEVLREVMRASHVRTETGN